MRDEKNRIKIEILQKCFVEEIKRERQIIREWWLVREKKERRRGLHRRSRKRKIEGEW